MTISVGIAGAGLLGRTLAFELIKRGCRVTLFDRDTVAGQRSCAYTGAGMLAPYCELPVSSELVFRLGKHAVRQWSAIVDSLSSPVFMQESGTLVIAHSGDEVLLEQFILKLNRKLLLDAQQESLSHDSESRCSNGGCDSEPVVRMTSDQLMELEPSLGTRFESGYFARGEGQIDNRELLGALEEYLRESDCRWMQNVEVLSTEGTGCITVKESALANDSRAYHFDFVVDCRGMGAKLQYRNLRGVRGEIIVVSTPEVLLYRPVRVLHPRYSIYVVPRANHQFLIGATSIECEDYSEITVLSTLELLTAAFSLNPSFANARILETRVNCRPALPANSPSIRVTGRLLEVNGLYRHGFLITPSIVSSVIGFFEGRSCDSGLEELFDTRSVIAPSQIDQLEYLCN
ncbi:MAG: FAD-dependent oxidoreductase [Candidatus Melainabacteria bacterium]|nr:MAG: FAD-dependent oxidoreductase [Candidatus Melainabacteria bacterium]